jgi:hypothetical protein
VFRQRAVRRPPRAAAAILRVGAITLSPRFIIESPCEHQITATPGALYVSVV